jgi:hypothetical protein
LAPHSLTPLPCLCLRLQRVLVAIAALCIAAVAADTINCANTTSIMVRGAMGRDAARRPLSRGRAPSLWDTEHRTMRCVAARSLLRATLPRL